MASIKDMVMLPVMMMLLISLIHSTEGTTLTAAQIKEVVDLHNKLRAEQGASDMRKMEWNNAIATDATNLADKCVWEHSHPSDQGQNLASSDKEVLDIHYSIMAWYNEKFNYDISTNACSYPPCGHYTQLVWSTSYEIGCGYKLCSTISGLGFGGIYFVCNYKPRGNYEGQKPFIVGPSCTKCPSDAKYCNSKGLCISSCSDTTGSCECKRECMNGATQTSTCTCSCKAGWRGDFCQNVCVDGTRCYPQASKYYPVQHLLYSYDSYLSNNLRTMRRCMSGRNVDVMLLIASSVNRLHSYLFVIFC